MSLVLGTVSGHRESGSGATVFHFYSQLFVNNLLASLVPGPLARAGAVCNRV